MFSEVYSDTMKLSVEYGDRTLTNYLVDKLESIVENKDPSYVTISKAKAYDLWFNGKYSETIAICERAIFLLESAQQPEDTSLKHDYALALRDSKQPEQIEKALDIFLSGEDMNLVANNTNINRSLGGAFYGNIGRCLQFLGRLDEALDCLCKSFILIHDNDNDANKLINVGYASQWLSEVLRDNDLSNVSRYFYRLALDKWKISSPPLHNKLKNTPLHEDENEPIMEIEDWRVEKYCKDWVKERVKIDKTASNELQ